MLMASHEAPELFYYDYEVREQNSYIRLLHASPGAPRVDVYANGNRIARNLGYREFTPYLNVAPGTYNIGIFPAGQTTNPIYTTSLDIPARSIFTVAAINRPTELRVLPIREPIMNIPAGKVYVRFAHLSPNAPNVDVALADGTRLFTNIGYRRVTDYITVNPGVYNFNVFPTGSGQSVLYVPNIRLLPNRFYTIYAVGLAGGQPSLQVLIPLDGNSYLKPR